jgi:hypothetical protein
MATHADVVGWSLSRGHQDKEKIMKVLIKKGENNEIIIVIRKRGNK